MTGKSIGPTRFYSNFKSVRVKLDRAYFHYYFNYYYYYHYCCYGDEHHRHLHLIRAYYYMYMHVSSCKLTSVVGTTMGRRANDMAGTDIPAGTGRV